jgi:hypothetical protein
MYSIGGDHTRTAVTELHEQFPAQEKWQMFKDVTILVSGESLECCSMLRDLGVMYNSKQYHKDMGFADRMILTRKYYADTGMLAKGMRRTEQVIAWCEKQCALAGIPNNSWSQYAACARVDEDSWFFMEAILKGQYAAKIGRGAVPATIPTSQSPFIQIMTCPPEIIRQFLEKVYNGKMSITGLRVAAENYKAYALTKDMIVWTVEKAAIHGATEEVVEKAYPFLLSRTFICQHVPGVKLLLSKNKKLTKTEVPTLLKERVLAHLRESKLVRVCFRTALDYFHSCKVLEASRLLPTVSHSFSVKMTPTERHSRPKSVATCSRARSPTSSEYSRRSSRTKLVSETYFLLIFLLYVRFLVFGTFQKKTTKNKFETFSYVSNLFLLIFFSHGFFAVFGHCFIKTTKNKLRSDLFFVLFVLVHTFV